MTQQPHHVDTYNGKPVVGLVHHVDADGDLLRVFSDPGGDPIEDLWIGVTDMSTGHTNAVRIPRAMLLAALKDSPLTL